MFYWLRRFHSSSRRSRHLFGMVNKGSDAFLITTALSENHSLCLATLAGPCDNREPSSHLLSLSNKRETPGFTPLSPRWLQAPSKSLNPPTWVAFSPRQFPGLLGDQAASEELPETCAGGGGTVELGGGTVLAFSRAFPIPPPDTGPSHPPRSCSDGAPYLPPGGSGAWDRWLNLSEAQFPFLSSGANNSSFAG